MEVNLIPSSRAWVSPLQSLFLVFWGCKARVPATALPWPVELADHSFPSTNPGSWLVAPRSPEGCDGTWWAKLGPDTWKGLLMVKPSPIEEPIRTGRGPCTSAPRRVSRGLGGITPGRPALSGRTVLSPRHPTELPLRLFHPRLWLALMAKFSTTVGRLQGIVPAGNSRMVHVRTDQ